ncbi:MAG: hypothetical protein ABI251_09895 [Mycobacteriaceae bacterium]
MTESYPSNAPQTAGVGPMPGDNEIRTESAVAPAEVEKSFKLWLVSIGLGVLGVIASLLLFDSDDAINKAMQSSSELTRDQASAGVTFVLVAGIVFVAVVIGLELLFAFKMRAGRNWARIVLTVLGVLGVLFSLFGLAAGFSLSSALNLVSMIVVIAAIVFMFKPAASAYFSRPKY